MRSRADPGPPNTALFYSPVESAELCGDEPCVYLGESIRRAMRNAGTVTLARDLK